MIGGSFISQSCINDNDDPVPYASSQGVTVDARVGGPTEPNQVWVDLSNVDLQGQPNQILTTRTDWDLAFYTGQEFKVVLNSSIIMAASKIPNATDINNVNALSVASLQSQVQVANFKPENTVYIDDVKGDFPNGYTAIDEVKTTEAENGIYLINMGKEVYQGSVAVGSVANGGADRGWMKFQVIREGAAYRIKYGDLNATGSQIKTAIINKNTAYNYNFFSLKNNKEVSIQPEKNKWDLCFTVFTNIIEGAGSYVYADFVTTNNMGNVSAYEVHVSSGSTIEAFNNFDISKVENSKFIHDDQRVIGSNWREVGPSGYQVKGDVFYVIKDAAGTYYKLRFTRLTSAEGVRGNPKFQYKVL